MSSKLNFTAPKIKIINDYSSTWNYDRILMYDTMYFITNDEPIQRELSPQICKCCGAPFHSKKCEYCEVEYA